MNRPTLKERFTYWFDTRMSRGSLSLIRVLIIASVFVVVVLSGLMIVLGFSDGAEPGELIWNGFSTIINAWMPSWEEGTVGYLILTACIAVFGLLFTSVLIGIMSSAIEEKIIGLRKGNSNVLENDHIIVLGFYPGEYTLLNQLILASPTRPQCIVVAGNMERDEMEQLIHENIQIPRNIRIICRNVDIFDPASIRKCSPLTCRTIIISPTDDNSTVKALLAVSSLVDRSRHSRIRINAIISRNEYKFPMSIARRHNISTLQIDDILAKVIARTCTQTGLSRTFEEVFNFEGSELYSAEIPGITGMTFAEVSCRLENAVPVGINRNGKIMMNPGMDAVIEKHDKMLVFAENNESFTLSADTTIPSVPSGSQRLAADDAGKVVICGTDEKICTILRELPENVSEVVFGDICETSPDYEEILAAAQEKNIRVSFFRKDTTKDSNLTELLQDAKHVVILNDSRGSDEEQSDLNTIFTLLNVRDIRTRHHFTYNITSEMRCEHNQKLVITSDYTDFVVASNMASVLLAQLSESPELTNAFREILSNKGNELYLKPAGLMHCTGTHSVRTLRMITLNHGCVFLGYMKKDHSNIFNPALSDEVTLEKGDNVIVLGLD